LSFFMDGGSLRAHGTLRGQIRDRSGRDPMVSAAVVDAQSVRARTPWPAKPRLRRRQR